MTGRFVVLEHRWKGVHWDVMLETRLGGPLRTWAVVEPIVPGRDLPARALRDHRAVYLDYEGGVAGGRGTVTRLDRGIFETILWTDDLVRVRLEGSQFAGLVELREAVSGGGSEDWLFCLGKRD